MTEASDVPFATVAAIGPSEIASALALLSSVLVALFGHDFGVSANAQALAALAVALIPIGLSLSRALKHQAAIGANATVLAAQLHTAPMTAVHVVDAPMA